MGFDYSPVVLFRSGPISGLDARSLARGIFHWKTCKESCPEGVPWLNVHNLFILFNRHYAFRFRLRSGYFSGFEQIHGLQEQVAIRLVAVGRFLPNL